MLSNLLASTLLTGLYTFFIGIAVVFLGITIIVILVQIAGKIFAINEKRKNTIKNNKQDTIKENNIVLKKDNDVSDEIKAVIIATISMYYFENNQSNCDFIVKKIKKI